MDSSVREVRSDLAKQFECDWIEAPELISCPLLIVHGLLEVYPGANGLVDSITLNPVITVGPERDPIAEARSRTIAVSVVSYFLPSWKEGPVWISKAMRDVERPHTKRVTHVGPITVMVHWLQPALPDTHAVIVLTKRASLEEFEAGLDW
jgi:hypothetical protein